MKEEPTDHVVLGFKVPADGWHVAKFQSGIDFLPAPGGGEGYWQNDKGFKTLKLPALVDDPDDPDNGGLITTLINLEGQQKILSGILLIVGLWDAVVKRFPGKDVTVFDQPVIEGVKVKLPGLSCMIRSEVDKKGNAAGRELISFAKYKELQAAEKGKAAQGGKGKGAPAAAAPEPAAETPKEW